MHRIDNAVLWFADTVKGVCIFAAIMAVAFWDSVVVGRSFDEQMDREDGQ